jgi:lipid-A-disaccharide synthase
MIAGEASGDILGAHLAEHLRALDPDLVLTGIGGEGMRAAGVDLYAHVREMGVVGVWELLPKIVTILRVYRETAARLRRGEADLLVLIDYPGFNIRMAGVARRLGIPVFYYVSPQVWAWKSGRIRTLAQRVTTMMVIFPFEEALYREAGLDCSFVGHPLMDDMEGYARGRDLLSEDTRRDQKRSYGLDAKRPVVGLFPGSRGGEISYLLPSILRAAARIHESDPKVQFLLAVAPTLRVEDLQAIAASVGEARDLPMKWIEGDANGALLASDAVIAASGTLTLQAALLERPMVIVYRVSSLTFALARLLVRVDHAGLPNIVAGRRVVPELIQKDAEPERIADETLRYLNDPAYRSAVRESLGEVRRRLGSPGASERAARIVLGHS